MFFFSFFFFNLISFLKTRVIFMSIVQPEHRAKRRKVDTNGAKGLAFGRVGCPADVAAPVEACKDPSESRQVC